MDSGPYETKYDTGGLSAGDKLTVEARVKDENGNEDSDSESKTL